MPSRKPPDLETVSADLRMLRGFEYVGHYLANIDETLKRIADGLEADRANNVTIRGSLADIATALKPKSAVKAKSVNLKRR